MIDLMSVNIDKVLERDQKLCQLDDKAEYLQADAIQFKASAGKLRTKNRISSLGTKLSDAANWVSSKFKCKNHRVQ